MRVGIILSISKTHLVSRKRQTFIASLGVTFGIAAYVIMMSFMTGLNGILDDMILNRTPHVHIYNELSPSSSQPIERASEYKDRITFVHSIKPKDQQTGINNAPALMRRLSEMKDVRGVTPTVKAQGFYLGGTAQLNASLIGIDVVKEAELYNLNAYITLGTSDDLAKNENGILLGKGVADKLSLDLGDIIQIGTISGQLFQFKIVGIFQSGLAEMDNVQSYINIKAAQRVMGEGIDYFTDINVKLHDMEKAPEICADLEHLYGVNAVDIQTANAQFDTGSSIRSLISYAVSITLLIVAGFGIYNILNMLIFEKMNDIAILKATGFSGRDVGWIFLSQAIMIGIMGAILGLLIGYAASLAISKTPFETEALPTIKTFPVNFDPKFYLIAVGFALLFTVMAGYFPSRKARKMDPVDIIRGQ